jgi:hypothetical protein
MAAVKKARMLELKAALAPYCNPGHYLNFAEEAVDVADSFAPSAFERLRAVKHRVDPDNMIHANHAI